MALSRTIETESPGKFVWITGHIPYDGGSLYRQMKGVKKDETQLRGTIKSIKLGSVMAEVVVELPDGQQIVSAITRGSVENLGLQVGSQVYAIIKSTEVMIGKDS